MTTDAVMLARLDYSRHWWNARWQCPRCRPSMPCASAQHAWLLVDAASIAYDLAVAVDVEDRIRASVPY